MSADTTICEGGSATMFALVTGGDGNYSYNWNSGLGNSDSITVSPTSSFVLTVNVTDGCDSPPVSMYRNVNVVSPISTNYSLLKNVSCFGGNDGSAIVNVTGGGQAPFNYLWSNGISNAANNNIAAGVYTVTITDFIGCSTTSSITISEPTLLILNPLSNSTLCSGNSDTLTASSAGGSAPYRYLWSTGATSSGLHLQPVSTSTYTVTVTDAEGCSATSSAIITVLPPLSITSLTANDSICKGESITINVTAAGGNGNYIYTWNSIISTSSFTITPQTDTSLFLILSDGCTSPNLSRAITITVIETPEVAFDFSPENGCQPLTVFFKDSTKTVTGSSYLWDFGNGSTSAMISPTATYINYGTYDIKLTVTTPQGCSNSLIKQSVNVYEKPIASFDFTPDKPTLYYPVVYFTDNSTGNNVIWYWEFGDGNTSSDQNPNHNYRDTGTYKVLFAATNAEGCSDTTSYELYIADEYAFYIPNAFTPDGDGQNDFFIMSGINYKQVEVQIFNRYGGTLYQSSSLNHFWDGKDKNGTIVQEGKYAYQIIVTENQGKKHTYTGTVSVIR
jgi:gliding motility-associated-like protein